ncbi:MAG: 30S ribosomal protein S20 [Dehalococcoidia bacterium]|nr:30S ribosomal protein S20 [Dehalococcoidia bacterium]
MANTKTALKQWRVSLKRRAHNRPMRAAIRSFLTQARTAVAQHAENADTVVVKAISELDKAVSKGLMHRNAAARRKSRLMKRLNASK